MTDDIIMTLEEQENTIIQQAETISRQAETIYRLSLLLMQHLTISEEEEANEYKTEIYE